MHAIRDLTRQIADQRLNSNRLSSETLPLVASRGDYDEKLEQCCQRLEELTNKVDRLMSFESTGRSQSKSQCFLH